MIILIIGPSAVGKTTIVNKIKECPADSSLLGKPINTITTRAPRDEDEHYQYVSISEFQRLIEEDQLVEWANVHGNYYGTSKSYFNNVDENFYKIIDYQGALQLISKFGEERFRTFFIYPTSLEELKYRLSFRGDGNEETRMKNALTELTFANRFNYVIINDDLNVSVNTLKTILNRC